MQYLVILYIILVFYLVILFVLIMLSVCCVTVLPIHLSALCVNIEGAEGVCVILSKL